METDKYVEVADGHFFTAKNIGETQIKMRGNNGKPFIAMFYTILFATDLCGWLISIIMLINLVHTFLFNKGFCKVFFGDNKHNAVMLP